MESCLFSEEEVGEIMSTVGSINIVCYWNGKSHWCCLPASPQEVEGEWQSCALL